MKYIYKKHTISNRKGDVVELQQDERTRQLIKIGAIEPIEVEKPKPKRKGGRKPQDSKAETK